MLIALVGPPQAGKHTVADYLVSSHGFTLVSIGASSRHLPSSSTSSNTAKPASSAPTPLLFDSPRSLLDHATAHWREKFVTLDLCTLADVQVGFDKRPFFLLVAIDAPLGVRFRRQQELSLEEFVEQDDRVLYGLGAEEGEEEPHVNGTTSDGDRVTSTSNGNGNGSQHPPPPPAPTLSRSGSHTPGVSSLATAPTTSPTRVIRLGIDDLALTGGPDPLPTTTSSSSATTPLPLTSTPTSLHPLQQQAHLVILNPFPTLSPLHSHLSHLSLPSPHRLRPSWDAYFLSLCSLASLRSNCMKRRVGAVLVSTSEKRVLSTGYNGTPRGLPNCNEGGCHRCNNPLTTGRGGANLTECFCLHAEENALLEVGRGLARGATLYCNTCPCMRCAVKIVQVGVDEVVFQLDYQVDHRSADVFREAGVRIRKYGEV